MKKSIFYFVAAALTMASCSEDELVNSLHLKSGVLKATFEQETVSTRVNISDNNSLSWSEGDAIAVFGETPVKYEYQTNSDGIFVVENGKTSPENISAAVFPYSKNVSLGENTLTMSLPSVIEQVTNGELDMPMWGVINENVISFKHLAGVLKVNLSDVPEGYNKLIVTASNPISGEFSANIKEESTPVLSSNSTNEADKTLEVNFNESSSQTLYLPLPVGTYESIVVSISGEDKEDILLKNWADKTVARAKIYSTSADAQQTESELKDAFEKVEEYAKEVRLVFTLEKYSE